MKVLFIGGTGNISMRITDKLARDPGVELYLLNRGSRSDKIPAGVKILKADVKDEAAAKAAVEGLKFDAVADFIAFTTADLERDYRLFAGRTRQFVFISSASAYQKPPAGFPITESTPLVNPYWQYSRDKIACEEYLTNLFREGKFPVTIVRPSHTYSADICVLHWGFGTLSRIARGKTVVIPGDGLTLWTLTHSDDFAKAFIGLLGNPQALGEVFHITSDQALTWNQIYQLHADALGVQLRAVHAASDFICRTAPNDMWGELLGDKSCNGVFDNTKIKRAVPGFSAGIRFDAGVGECVEAFRKTPALQAPNEAYDKWCDAVEKELAEAASRVKAGL
ncbi:MAG: SDR family oxidoreductase [Clostridiales bacterium]|nr:SDR family oxidoreductase [Clostridiales bacterium]